MEHNFWFWLIQGLTNVIVALANLLPFHTTWGMSDYVFTFLSTAVTPLLLYVGAFFSLCYFMFFMGILVVLEGARLIMAAYRTVVKLIPLP